MKAIVQDIHGSADVPRLGNIDELEVGDRDELMRVHAAGMDPGGRHLMTGLPYLVRILGCGLRAPTAREPGKVVVGAKSPTASRTADCE